MFVRSPGQDLLPSRRCTAEMGCIIPSSVSSEGNAMSKWWKVGAVAVGLLTVGTLVGASLATAQGVGASARPASGPGSCTLKGWNPATDPQNAKNLPIGQRPQTYKPDNFDCTG